MPEKAINNNASGCLVLILPLAFILAIVFVAWPLLLLLVVAAIGLRIWQNYQWQKWSQQVNPFFHKLLQENQGRITAMDLAMKANIPGSSALRYLETKATEFGAQRRDYQEQGQVYYFITAKSLGSIFDQSEPSAAYEDEMSAINVEDEEETEAIAIEQTVQPSESKQQQTVTDPWLEEQETGKKTQQPQTEKRALIQSELARRLDVHSSTILKHRRQQYFTEWSQSRDPEGIAWKYERKTKMFVPVDTMPKKS